MTIIEIRAGDKVEGIFIVDTTEIKEGSTGPYLALSLRDKTGQMRGVLWQGAKETFDSLGGRDFARVEGVASEYRGTLNLKLSSIVPLEPDEVDMDQLLEVVPEGVETWHSRLIDAAANVRDSHCQDVVDAFIYDEKFMETFLRAPAAVSVHHDYIGGLLQHTTGVMTLAIFASLLYPETLNRDILITGAFLHDLGKCLELSGGVRREYTREGRFLGHISLGVTLIEERIARLPHFPPELALSLKHMILAHHGELEFGSPVKPATPEAALLHHLDGLDAKLNHILRVIEKAGDNPERRPYSRILGTDVQRESYLSQIDESARRAPYELPWEYDPMAMYLQQLGMARLYEQIGWVRIERFLLCPTCGAENSLYKTMKSSDSVEFEMKTKCGVCQKWGYPLRMNRFPRRNGGKGEDAE
jgi:3'-5' exoribonuclease